MPKPQFRPYFTLLTREGPDQPWAPQFGDWSRATVEQEQQDSYRDSPECRIIRTKPDQQSIAQAAAELSRREPD